MKNIHTSVSAIALAMMLPATSVQANDWSGAYFGISGGYSFGDIEAGTISQVGDGKAKSPPETLSDDFSALKPEGFEGQAFLGYRLQTDNLVYGAEVGLSSGNISDDSESFDDAFSFGESYFLRGIVGAELQGALVFGLLGVVSTAIEAETRFDVASDQGRATGVSVGIGYERMLTEQWAVRTDVTYTTYSDDFDLAVREDPDFEMKTDLSSTSIQIGAVYRF